MSARATTIQRARTARAAGFTLIEMLAVLLILSLLVGVLVVQLGGAGEVVQGNLTESRLAMIGAVLSEYELERGDWPASQLTTDQGAAPNATNLGAECLVIALWSREWDGKGVDDLDLVNSDGDLARKRLVDGFDDLQLRELADHWGNPIAYFHHNDYGREDLYVTFDPVTGEPVESVARARKDPDTGRWYRGRKFQLLSAGSDGLFGTEDDIDLVGR